MPLKVCVPPIITLIPSAPSRLIPIQYRSEQDIYIDSQIVFNCNSSNSLKASWLIVSCRPSCSIPVTIDKQRIEVNSAQLFIRGRSLPIGFYEMKLMLTVMETFNETYNSSNYVNITETGINANLLPLGTSFVTNGHLQDLLLDPGRYSVDFDNGHFNASVCRVVSSCFSNRFILFA